MELEPYPVEGLGCFGEDYPDDPESDFSGQCCAGVECYSPADGVCASANELHELTEEDGGEFNVPEVAAGLCTCGDDDVTGPYLPRDDHTPSRAGSCCYIITGISCVGRPFLVEDQAIVAPLARRGDWGSPLATLSSS